MIVEPSFTETDVAAIQAVNAGVATGDQQKWFMGWIAAELFRMQADDTALATADFHISHLAGRHYCGMWIVKLLQPSMLMVARDADAKKKAERQRAATAPALSQPKHSRPTKRPK